MMLFNSTMEARKAMETKHISYYSVCAICSKELYNHGATGAVGNLWASVSRAGASRLEPRFGVTEDKR